MQYVDGDPAGRTGSMMVLWPLVRHFDVMGLDVDVFLGRWGLNREALKDAYGRLPGRVLREIWCASPAFADDENVGIHAARSYEPGMFQVLDYVVATAPNIGGALQSGMEHARLLHDTLDLQMRVEGRDAMLSLQPQTSVTALRAQVECFFACVMLVGQRLSGVRGHPTELWFRHPAPRDLEPARAMFRCPIRYDAGVNAMRFPAAFLGTKSTHGDPVLAGIVSAYAQQLQRQIPETTTLTARIRRLLEKDLSSPLGLEGLARPLAISSRTLRRRLQEAGTNYQELLLETRLDASRSLLGDSSIAVNDMAAVVGFASATAFSRAFKRATGLTPSAYRRQLSGPPAERHDETEHEAAEAEHDLGPARQVGGAYGGRR